MDNESDMELNGVDTSHYKEIYRCPICGDRMESMWERPLIRIITIDHNQRERVDEIKNVLKTRCSSFDMMNRLKDELDYLKWDIDNRLSWYIANRKLDEYIEEIHYKREKCGCIIPSDYIRDNEVIMSKVTFETEE